MNGERRPTGAALPEAGEPEAIIERVGCPERRVRLVREFDCLKRAAVPHLFPVGANKKPIGPWVNGNVNFVRVAATVADRDRWVADPRVEGWAVLCGNKTVRIFVLDVECAGMRVPEIRAALALLPSTCLRSTPRGGVHAVIQLTSGEAVVTESFKRDKVLLAEVRGASAGTRNGAYAVVTGPGRGQLPLNFAPAKMSEEEADELLAMIRSTADRPSPSPRRGSRPSAHRGAGCSHGEGGGTGAVISRALAEGRLSWLDLLDPGWQIVSVTQERIGLLRPDYSGDGGPTSEESGNAVGSVLVVHSSAVPWAEPQQSFNPPQAFAAAWFKGDFAAAMGAAETAAARSAGSVAGRICSPFSSWPTAVLAELWTQRSARVLDFRTARARRLQRWARSPVCGGGDAA